MRCRVSLSSFPYVGATGADVWQLALLLPLRLFLLLLLASSYHGGRLVEGAAVHCENNLTFTVASAQNARWLQRWLTACPNSVFEVDWVGRVNISPLGGPIQLPSDGNVRLTVNGRAADDGTPAEVAGNGTYQLFAYYGGYINGSYQPPGGIEAGSDGHLLLYDLILSGGAAPYKNEVNGKSLGGAVAMDRGLLKAQNVLFRNNSAEWDGGGAVFIRGRLLPEALEAAIVAGDAATLKEERRAVFLNCSFQSNLAHGNGGAVFLYQTVGFFSDSKLWQNSCLEGNGGAVFVHGGSVSFVRSDLHFNSAGNGGALHVEGGDPPTNGTVATHAVVEINACNVEDNSALNTDGGGLKLDNHAAATVMRSRFRRNKSAGEGGAIYVNNYGDLVLQEGSEIDNNEAATTGGGVHLQVLSNLGCSDTSVTGNVAGENGGGVYAFERVSMEWNLCNVTSNLADLNGGGLFMTTNSNLTSKWSRIGDNFVRIGGAAAVVAGGSRMHSLGDEFVAAAADGAVAGTGDATSSSEAALQVALQTGKDTSFLAYGTVFDGWSDSYAVLYAGAAMVLDSCDFSKSGTGPYVVFSGPAKHKSPPVVVRNAVLSNATWAAVEYAADATFSDNAYSSCSDADAHAVAAAIGNGSDGTLCSGGGCRDSAFGVLCPCYVPALLLPANGATDDETAGETASVCLGGAVGGAALRMADSGIYIGLDDPEIFANLTAALTSGTARRLTGAAAAAVNSAANSAAVAAVDAASPIQRRRLVANAEFGADGVIFALSMSTAADQAGWTIVPSLGILLPGGFMQVRVSAPSAGVADGEADVAVTAVFATDAETAEEAATASFTYYHCDKNEWYEAAAAGTAAVGTCVSCADSVGIDCSAPGNSLEWLALDAGYWRATTDTVDAQLCFSKKACKGGPPTPRIDESAPAAAATAGAAVHAAATSSSGDDPYAFSDGYCAGGYGGPLCGVCEPGYARGLGDACKKCTDGVQDATYAAIAILSFLLALALWALLRFLVATPSVQPLRTASGRARSFDVLSGALDCCGCRRWLKNIPWSKLKIPVVTFQIITLFASITGAVLPPVYANFLAGLSFVNVDIGLLLSAGCLAPEFDFYGRLLVSTLVPLGVLALVGLTAAFGVWRCRHHAARAAAAAERRRVLAGIGTYSGDNARPTGSGGGGGGGGGGGIDSGRGGGAAYDGPGTTVASMGPSADMAAKLAAARMVAAQMAAAKVVVARHKLVVLVLTFLIYSSVSTVIFQTFKCVNTGDGEYLRADLTLECYTAEHRCYMGFAGVMIFIYPVGIPLSFLWLLVRHRGRIAEMAAVLPADVSVSNSIDRWRGGSASGAGDNAAGSGGGGGGSRAGGSGSSGHASKTGLALSQRASSRRLPVERPDPLPAPPSRRVPAARSFSEATATVAAAAAMPAAGAAAAGRGHFVGAGNGDVNRGRGAARPGVERVRPHAAHFLALSYRPETYYFEPIECARRLLLTGALVFILPDSPAQSAVACVLCVVFLAAFALLQPFEAREDAVTYTLGALVIFLTMLDSLVIKAEQADAESGSQTAVAAVLITMNVLLVAFVIGQMGMLAAVQIRGDADARDSAFYKALLSVYIDIEENTHQRAGSGAAGAEDGDLFTTAPQQGRPEPVPTPAPVWTVGGGWSAA